MAKLLKDIFKRLFQVFIFLLPVQLGYHFWPTWSFVFGIRVDYLSPTLYLTDVLFVGLLLLFLLTQKAKKKVLFLGLAGIILFGFINTVFSVSFGPAVYKWVKIFEFFSLGVVVATTKDLEVNDWVIKPLLLSSLGVSVMAILQVIKGGSLGGALYLLGERAFSLSTPGIALAEFGGREILRAYSVFSHPNSLAGFLGAAILLSLPFLFKKVKGITSFLYLVPVVVAFLFTFSLGPTVSLVILAVTLFFTRETPGAFIKMAKGLLFLLAVLSILLPFLSSRYANLAKPLGESYSRRADLSVAAGKMFSDKPLFGIGQNNFVVRLPDKNVGHPFSWWLQPVHNIFLLSLSETGLTGFLLLVLLFYLGLARAGLSGKENLAAALLFVVATGFFDHYWLTLQQNQLFLAVLLGLSFKNA